MLDDRIINKLIDRLVNRVEQANTYVLEKIGESIKKIGALTPSKARQLQQVLKFGGNYDKIARRLAKITELNVAEIYEIFEEVAKNDYEFSRQFYEYRGINYIPYEKNIALQNQVRALANITANEYVNFSNTLAFSRKVNGKTIYTSLSRTYQRAIDEAFLSVAQGKETFDSQMSKIIKELSSSGIRVVDYNTGYSRRLDSAVRMNLKGALRGLHNELQNIVGEEFGADGVEISVHQNPAIDHEKVQGRQFSKEEYKKLNDGLPAKDYMGKTFTLDHDHKNGFRPISTMNCYHYIFNIVLGVNKPEYSEEQLQEIRDNNNKGFEFDGEHYTNYEGTQLQRSIETAIRKQKDIQIMAKASYNNAKPEEQLKIRQTIDESQKKIKQLTKKYKELCEVSGLPTKVQRLKVAGYKRVNVENMK